MDAHVATYTIKYAFKAEEPTELSVDAGELVRAAEGAHSSAEPWTLVETAAPPFNKGFVPTSYLRPAPASAAQAQAQGTPMGTLNTSRAAPPSTGASAGSVGGRAPPRTPQDSTPPPPPPPAADPVSAYATNAASVGPVRRLSDPRLPHHLLEALSVNPPEEHAPAPSPRDSAVEGYELSLRPFQTDHAPAFAQHDRSFQQIMHQRHEQLRGIDDAAADVARRLEATRGKAAELAHAMNEVNAVIEQERRRWKELQASSAASFA